MKKLCLLATLFGLLMAGGCASVTVTKTAKGYFAPTDADDVDILMTIPNREFVELATVTTQRWSTKATAKMHNSLRAKCAPLGANAVILRDTGIDPEGYYWATGVAIRFKE